MTVGAGVSVAGQFHNEASEPMASSSVLSRVSTRLSVSSVASFLHRSEYHGPLSLLTSLVSKHTALYYATILSTECYTQPIRLGIVHRFLLMELARPGKGTIWLRLDRRPTEVSTLRFLGAGGSTPANDTVSISPLLDSYRNLLADTYFPFDLDSTIIVKIFVNHFGETSTPREPSNIQCSPKSFSPQPALSCHNREAIDISVMACELCVQFKLQHGDYILYL